MTAPDDSFSELHLLELLQPAGDLINETLRKIRSALEDELISQGSTVKSFHRMLLAGPVKEIEKGAELLVSLQDRLEIGIRGHMMAIDQDYLNFFKSIGFSKSPSFNVGLGSKIAGSVKVAFPDSERLNVQTSNVVIETPNPFCPEVDISEDCPEDEPLDNVICPGTPITEPCPEDVSTWIVQPDEACQGDAASETCPEGTTCSHLEGSNQRVCFDNVTGMGSCVPSVDCAADPADRPVDLEVEGVPFCEEGNPPECFEEKECCEVEVTNIVNVPACPTGGGGGDTEPVFQAIRDPCDGTCITIDVHSEPPDGWITTGVGVTRGEALRDGRDQCIPGDDTYVIVRRVGERNCRVQEACDSISVNEEVVGSGRTESLAFQAAREHCGPETIPPDLDDPPKIEPSGSSFCNLESYVETSLIAQGVEQIDLSTTFTSVFGLIDPRLGFIGKFLSGNSLTDEVATAIGNFVGSLSDKIGETIVSFSGAGGCASADSIALFGGRILASTLANWVSPELDYYATPLKYAGNRACPLIFPDVSEATQAYLANEISPQIFESWVNLNGYCSEPWSKVTHANRAKPAIQDLIAQFRRGIIEEPEFETQARGLGFLEPEEISNLFKESEQRPPISELIRYMVRDAGDEKVVADSGFDEDFAGENAKYTGQLKEWAKDQGIPDEVMKFAWRAHWSIPGPQALYEMLHRRVLPGDEDEQKETIRKALKQQDIAPGWIEPLLDISFRPLTRIDTRRAFDIGAIEEPQMHDAFLDQGYDKDNAQILVDFNVQLKNNGIHTERAIADWKAEAHDRAKAVERLQKLKYDDEFIAEALHFASARQKGHSAVKLFSRGLIGLAEAENRLLLHGIAKEHFDQWLADEALEFFNHPAVKEYLSGEIDRLELLTVLNEAVGGGEALAELMQRIDRKFDAKRRKVCSGAIEDRFLLGELDEDDARRALLNLEIPLEMANRDVASWVCVKEAKGKQIPASTLCQWLEFGIIDAGEFIDRARNLGYDPDDAMGLLMQCSAKLAIKQQKEAERVAKRAEQDAEKAAKDAAKLARDALTVSKNLRKARERATALRIKREETLIKASQRFCDKCDTELPEVYRHVKTAKAQCKSEFSLTEDEIIRAINAASVKAKNCDADDIGGFICDAARGFAEFEVPINGNGNGST